MSPYDSSAACPASPSSARPCAWASSRCSRLDLLAAVALAGRPAEAPARGGRRPSRSRSSAFELDRPACRPRPPRAAPRPDGARGWPRRRGVRCWSCPGTRTTRRGGGRYLYWSTLHWQPMVNGWGGFFPVGATALGTTGRHFPVGARRPRAARGGRPLRGRAPRPRAAAAAGDAHVRGAAASGREPRRRLRGGARVRDRSARAPPRSAEDARGHRDRGAAADAI